MNCEPRINRQKFHSLRAIATLLDVHLETVRVWIREGRLEAYRLKGCYRISDAQLALFLEQARGEVTVKAGGQ